MFQEVEECIKHKKEVLQLLNENVELAQNKVKQQANQHHNEIHFEVRDLVFERLQLCE